MVLSTPGVPSHRLECRRTTSLAIITIGERKRGCGACGTDSPGDLMRRPSDPTASRFARGLRRAAFAGECAAALPYLSGSPPTRKGLPAPRLTRTLRRERRL